MWRVLVVATIVWLVTSAAAYTSAAESLTASEIRQLLFGNTASFPTPPGQERRGEYFLYYRPSGGIVGLFVLENGEAGRFGARGRFMGDHWCTALTTGDTREACWRIVKNGNRYRFTAVDPEYRQLDTDFLVLPGDAKQLAYVDPSINGILLKQYPRVSQKSAKSYRDPKFRELPDTASGRWQNGEGKRYRVKDLACLAAVYAMLERGRGSPDKRIDDGLYDDPRGKSAGGAGALTPRYVDATDSPLALDSIISQLRQGNPIVLRGRINDQIDHFVLVVGIRYEGTSLFLIANDPLPPDASDEAPAKAIDLRISGGKVPHPTISGLVFDQMRRVTPKPAAVATIDTPTTQPTGTSADSVGASNGSTKTDIRGAKIGMTLDELKELNQSCARAIVAAEDPLFPDVYRCKLEGGVLSIDFTSAATGRTAYKVNYCFASNKKPEELIPEISRQFGVQPYDVSFHFARWNLRGGIHMTYGDGSWECMNGHELSLYDRALEERDKRAGADAREKRRQAETDPQF